MRLWIDDIREMPSDFDIWAKTANEAIIHLKTNKITFVSFDHDLGVGMDGNDVAKFIECLAHDGQINRLKWQIHSQNPVGRDRILVSMNKADEHWEANEQLSAMISLTAQDCI